MPTTPSNPYYQLVLIRLNDPATFGRYLERLRPVVARYGGALERMLAPTTVHGDLPWRPDIVNIVYYDDRAAFTAFSEDPEFREIVHLRDASIDMIAVGGEPQGGIVTVEKIHERVYVVEVARFGADGSAGYRRYEAESERVMAQYDYHVERVLVPDAASALPFMPDLVKVAYFSTADGLSRMHDDPAHARIEAELYPAAVAASVWMIGGVHPSTLPRPHDET